MRPVILTAREILAASKQSLIDKLDSRGVSDGWWQIAGYDGGATFYPPGWTGGEWTPRRERDWQAREILKQHEERKRRRVGKRPSTLIGSGF